MSAKDNQNPWSPHPGDTVYCNITAARKGQIGIPRTGDSDTFDLDSEAQKYAASRADSALMQGSSSTRPSPFGGGMFSSLQATPSGTAAAGQPSTHAAPFGTFVSSFAALQGPGAAAPQSTSPSPWAALQDANPFAPTGPSPFAALQGPGPSGARSSSPGGPPAGQTQHGLSQHADAYRQSAGGADESHDDDDGSSSTDAPDSNMDADPSNPPDDQYTEEQVRDEFRRSFRNGVMGELLQSPPGSVADALMTDLFELIIRKSFPRDIAAPMNRVQETAHLIRTNLEMARGHLDRVFPTVAAELEADRRDTMVLSQIAQLLSLHVISRSN
ncbi:hypothetical protein CONPUDRAFT_149650 [Coniophora puteana RWD-64-598 SS2]|uniref:Uncharacterized protein n=1 Tax=Coniophora puteana (strain RWD-64-598) TaxID=741705 RepID=A0A5M3N054_CONPW|nr:uncharacterized protein CONPUDRAFT_149650 [Coniophora puteana RWD-64-598 SS2]EIW84780.1 hypothetical protein CONPUDRAFT_149650 [Coniophora puteana RWD-64-598 SS2]